MGISTPEGGHQPDADEPQYLKDLKELRENGGLGRVAHLIETNADVWIKRSNGDWQMGKACELGGGGISTRVEWFDEKRQKKLGKAVNTKVFLRW